MSPEKMEQDGISIKKEYLPSIEKVDEQYIIKYGIFSKKITKIELTADEYTDNVLTSRLHEYVTM